MPRRWITSFSTRSKAGTANTRSPAVAKITRVFTPTPLLRWNTSSARTITFWGAPPHLIGVSGTVKIAVPPRKASMASQVAVAWGPE